VLDNGSTVGVTGLVVGQWSPGVTAYVREDGIISATNPGLGVPLRGSQVFWLGADDTADLLALLHHSTPQNVLDVEDGLATPRRLQGDPDHRAPRRRGVQRGGDDLAGLVGRPEAPAGDRDPLAADIAAEPSCTDLEILGSESAPASSSSRHPLRLSDSTPTQARSRGTNTVASTRDVVGTSENLDDHAHGELSEMAAPLRISVLGPPRVWWRPTPPGLHTPSTEITEHEVTAAFAPRVRELLVFLALHPDGATREALVAALWPTSPAERTTNAMNTALTRLRRAVTAATEGTLSDVVLVSEGRYRLAPELVEVDYHRFATAMAARRTASTEQQRVDAYRQVVDSYTGPVADGLSTEWLETIREAIRRDAIDAVAALARVLVDQDPQQTLDLLEVARAFDPHNELIYRDIMRLQQRLGQLDAIPRTLTLLSTRLAEIDDQPTHHAVDLAQRLRHVHEPSR
jgi:DNA-binding SARP family transcriptional activator